MCRPSPGPDPLPIDPELELRDENALRVRRRAKEGRGSGRSVGPATLAVVALGGGVGAAARYGVSALVPVAPGQFPWATLCTNLSGSFLLGFALVLVVERLPPIRHLRPFLAAGVLGAFTTMSTFLVETALLVQGGNVATGLGYASATVVAGVLLAWAGITTARSLP